ncbi:MAG: hypothetical protein AB7V16_08290 [Vulcanibacillus sp.]
MINKENFENQIFKTKGIIEFPENKYLNRVPQEWRPSQNTSINSLQLRNELYNVASEKWYNYKETSKRNISFYDFIDLNCRIPEDTFKKAMNKKYNITRNFLSKFSVGLKLSFEESNGLFKLHSGELNLTNDFDFVVYHALKTSDEIDYFIEETEKYTGVKLYNDKAKI